MKRTNKEVKLANRNSIYRQLMKSKSMSKLDIANSLNMSLPTVSQNIKELLNEGLIEESGVFESTGGRKARAISFLSDAKVAVGLDITKNHTGIVLVNLLGEIISNKRVRRPFVNSADYFKQNGAFIQEFISESGIAPEKILGVGIAVPAIVSQDSQNVTYSPILGFTGGTLDSFSDTIPYPTFLCNDANAGGAAELWISPEKLNDVVYLSLNTSVGGAILMDNKIHLGNNQRGGEFGHMTIVSDGIQCYCGQKGCVDAYCSAKVLAESANGKLEHFFTRLQDGDTETVKIWTTYLEHLAQAVKNLRMAFDCNIILGGYVGSYMDDYIDELRSLVAAKDPFGSRGDYLQVCNYKLEATAVGAALMYIEPFIRKV